MHTARTRRNTIYRLWDELADFGAGNTGLALGHLKAALAGELGADDVLWVGAVRVVNGRAARRDVLSGWRVRVFQHLREQPDVERRSTEAMREQDSDPGMTTLALSETTGTFRVCRLRDGFIDFEAFRRTDHYRKFYRDLGVCDRMWAAFPVSREAESVFVADLYGARRRFSASDVQFFGEALRGLKWFHRQLFLSHGMHLADRPLPPSQRRVLDCLLTHLSEKQIADQLGLTVGTTHQYAVEIYRRFGVNGRAGLMALWLGNG